VTGIGEAEVADAPRFEEVWSDFRDFCGSDVVVAHNGYAFDFPILDRMSEPLGGRSFVTYDTLVLARELHPGSRRLGDLASHFKIEMGTAHRAMVDSLALAKVFLRLDVERLARARKTALPNLLDWLGIALALSGEPPVCKGQATTSDGSPACREYRDLKKLTASYALGRYSDALEQYGVQRDLAGDASLPTVEDLIARLGGQKRLERLRQERSADDRYPQAMARLRRLLAECDAPILEAQIGQLLELVALSDARADRDPRAPRRPRPSAPPSLDARYR
jgi:DNA polymerase III epsilon subunit-like protein